MARIPITATELYLAIQSRVNSIPIVPRVAREPSKVIYLPVKPQEEGLILKSLEKTDFIAGYSGLLVKSSDFLTDDKLRNETHLITLQSDVRDQKWLLVGSNEALATFVQRELTGMNEPISFEEAWLLDHLGFQRDYFSGAITVVNLDLFLRKVGTADVIFVPKDTQTYSFDTKEVREQVALRSREKQTPLFYRDYSVIINYPANAELTELPHESTFIIGPNNHILGGNAQNNRLVLWHGAMHCRVLYLKRLFEVDLEVENEILINYDRWKRPSYIPSDTKKLKRFERDAKRVDPMERFIYPSHLLYNPPGEQKKIDNFLLGEILRDLVPLVLLIYNLGLERPITNFYRFQEFATRYIKDLKLPLTTEEMRTTSRQLIVQTLYLLLPFDLQPHWVVAQGGGVSDKMMVLNFIALVHSLNDYLSTQQLEAITRRLYRHAYINVIISSPQNKRVTTLFEELHQNKQKQIGTILPELSMVALSDLVEPIRPYYEIPILGETNRLYRDTLYYMDNPENDEEHRFESELTHYTSMHLYEPTSEAFNRLIMPVSRLTNLLILTEEEDTGLPVSNTLRGLWIEMLFYADVFIRERRLADFSHLYKIYSNLYARQRLMPVTQLNDEWLRKFYTKSREIYLYTCVYFIENTSALNQGALTSNIRPYAYKEIKQTLRSAASGRFLEPSSIQKEALQNKALPFIQV